MNDLVLLRKINVMNIIKMYFMLWGKSVKIVNYDIVLLKLANSIK